MGLAAVGQPDSDASAALRFRSVRYCIIRLLQDAPSRAAPTRRPCLVDGGFPPSGPQEDLTSCMSHLVVLCSCRAHQGCPPAPAPPLAPPPRRALDGLLSPAILHRSQAAPRVAGRRSSLPRRRPSMAEWRSGRGRERACAGAATRLGTGRR